MIKKVLLITVTLFISYAIFIALKPIDYGVSQHQWQDNIVKAQKLIFNKQIKYNYIIVGSSLSCRLIKDSLPQKTYNLAFGGLSVYDGMSLLVSHKLWPKYVLIETNLIMRSEDKIFTSSLNNFIYTKIKQNIIALREDKQPLALLSTYINRFMNFFDYKTQYDKSNSVPKNKYETVNKLVNLNKANYVKPLDKSEINQHLLELKKFIKMLEQNHVKVIFYEMPIHPVLENTYLTKTIRKEIQANFQNLTYILPCNKPLETTDGLHLSQSSASYFTGFFRQKINAAKN